MPRLKLTLNLGTKDAERLGLDPADAKEGEVVDVEQEAADELLRQGWGTDPSEAKAKTKGTDAAAATPAPAVSEVDFDAMTKEELHAYAQANKVEGVNMGLHKDEMVKLVKRAAKKP